MKPWLTTISLCWILLYNTGNLHSLRAQVMELNEARIKFTSDAKLENITAETSKVKGLVDLTKNKFAFSLDVKTFQGFNSELQREHFMESYMQADEYPKAQFSGKLIDKINTTSSSQKVRAKGELEIHGIKKERIIEVQLTQDKNGFLLQSDFNVALEDHQIIIPRVVHQKISPVIHVNVSGQLVSKK